jgi:cytoskeletal protein RodZ
VTIGETLAAARRRAGLTIADVRARTGIREGLIRAVEHDDFAACGGDFYARAYIRAIAAVVGVDAEALIRQYDAAHRSSAWPEGPEDPPRRPATLGGRTAGLAIAAILTLAVIVFAAARVVSGVAGVQRPASPPSAAGQATARASGPPGSARPSAAPSAAPSVTAASATPSARPSPTAVPVTDVTPVSAAAFGPGGTSDGDNPQGASLALSGNPATPWHTDWYATAAFGNTKAGTGLLLDLGRRLTVTGATIQLGSTPGADFQLRAGTGPADLATVASDSGAGGLVRLRLPAPVRAQYLLIWFTLLPPDDDGTYQAYVSAVTATVAP